MDKRENIIIMISKCKKEVCEMNQIEKARELLKLLDKKENQRNTEDLVRLICIQEFLSERREMRITA